MKKRYLLTPGPTMVPPEVLLAGAKTMVHHRAPDFDPLFVKVSESLKYLFRTKNPVVTFASSGTGAMEAAVVSTLSPGDTAITVEGGKFGERWTELCKAYGAQPIVIKVEWGTAVQPEEIEKALRENPGAKAVFISHCETSTGALTDIKAIGAVVARTDALCIVDAVSSLGAEEVQTDEWHLDIVVTGSQKAVMLPPGLAFASVSEKARERLASAKCGKYYFSIQKYLKNLEQKTVPFTPAVSMIFQLEEALRMIQEEGLENVWARHRRLASATRAGIKSLGLELFARQPANVVTAVKVPEGIDGGKIVKILRDEHGITIAGGQEHLKGKIFRIAELGYADTFDVTTIISAIELTLKKLGFAVTLGAGVKAALEVLQEPVR
jgi:aspartate aminotransferase-like enzyme